jgi:hypothetical protein
MKAPNRPKILPPVGTFPARVYRIIYLGTVKGEYQGVPNENYQVSITWELPTKTHVFKEGEPAQPFSVSKTLTLSMGKKSSLRPIVEGMLGISFNDDEAKGFDLDEILGKTCLIGIAHKDTEDGKKVEIKSFSQIPEGMNCPAAINAPKILSYEKFDKEFFVGLPNWMKEKMEKTPEFIKMNGGAVEHSTEEINPQDIPF